MAYNLNITNADCYTGTTTLINKLGITDENELNSTEALITSYKAASIIKKNKLLISTLKVIKNCMEFYLKICMNGQGKQER